MITLIGFRCTHSNVLSHEVLIRPSRPETQTSQYMFATFTHLNLFYFTVLKIEMWNLCGLLAQLVERFGTIFMAQVSVRSFLRRNEEVTGSNPGGPAISQAD